MQYLRTYVIRYTYTIVNVFIDLNNSNLHGRFYMAIELICV